MGKGSVLGLLLGCKWANLEGCEHPVFLDRVRYFLDRPGLEPSPGLDGIRHQLGNRYLRQRSALCGRHKKFLSWFINLRSLHFCGERAFDNANVVPGENMENKGLSERVVADNCPEIGQSSSFWTVPKTAGLLRCFSTLNTQIGRASCRERV